MAVSVLGDVTPEEVGLSSAGLAKIDEVLSKAIADGHLPGVSTIIGRHGRIAHRSVAGIKNLADGSPLTADTLYAIYSMTKPVTAAAMMVLYDAGRWSPDDPIAKHLPEFADVQGPGGAPLDHAPTMRELMTHTAGFGYALGLGPHDDTDAAYIAAGVWQADGLADFARRVASVPLAYQPGSTWRYSLSMDLQGAIIERLSGQSLPDFMQEALFEPLGMADTGFHLPTGKLARLATVYHKYFVTELTVLDHPSFARDPRVLPKVASGGAGLYSTVDDYARFAQMLLNKGELGGVRVIQPASVELMTSNHLPQAIIDKDIVAGAQKITAGRGYGFNGAVFYDPKAAGSPVGRGTYQWDGASGVWFWIDPENDLFYVGMIQRMMQEGMPQLQAITQAMVAEALVK